MSKTRLLECLLTFLTVVAAGCGNGSVADRPGDARALAAIDSLLGIRSGNSLHMIDHGMMTAQDSMEWYEFYVRKARYYALSSTPDSLVPILDRVEHFSRPRVRTERGRQLLAYALNCRAAYYHNFHRHTDETVSLYHNAYTLLMRSADKSQTPKVAANLGDAYAFENDLPKAAAWYRRALFLVDSLQLPDKENTTLYLGLAGISQQLGDNETALCYYRKTERHMRQMTVSMQAYFLNNYGGYYYYNHDYRKSLGKFLAMRKLLVDNGMQDNFDMYLCKVNLADVYLNLGRLAEARSCLADVEPYARAHGDEALLYYCRTIRIGIAVKERQWGEVGRIIARPDSMPGGTPFQMLQIRNRYLCDYYTATGNYKQALDDFRDDVAYTDRKSVV